MSKSTQSNISTEKIVGRIDLLMVGTPQPTSITLEKDGEKDGKNTYKIVAEFPD
jgi:hypothetical protein